MSTETKQETTTPVTDALFRRASSLDPTQGVTYLLELAGLEKETWAALRRLERENAALKADRDRLLHICHRSWRNANMELSWDDGVQLGRDLSNANERFNAMKDII